MNLFANMAGNSNSHRYTDSKIGKTISPGQWVSDCEGVSSSSVACCYDEELVAGGKVQLTFDVIRSRGNFRSN